MKGRDLIRVQVCDSIMGSGKSTSAIRYINETEGRFIYLTPFLSEAERIKDACHCKNFAEPQDIKHESKLEHLHELLRSGRNIASTHALFKCFNEETANLVKNGGYELILDEAMDVVDTVDVKMSDIKILENAKMLEIVDNRLIWREDEYKGHFSKLKQLSTNTEITVIDDAVCVWEFPLWAFEAFKQVKVLTYLFPAQTLCYYFQKNNIDFEYIGTKRDGDGFRFTTVDDPDRITKIPNLNNLIDIVSRPKYNKIGSKCSALSASWYRRLGGEAYNDIRKLIRNVFVSGMQAKSNETMWTIFLAQKKYTLDSGYFGYIKSFVPCSMRATNRYKDRTKLAYCVNIYFHPALSKYFSMHGVSISDNLHALSEMIQWIWRSAIRDGKPIQVFVPSRRMRNLLTDWIAEVSS